MLSLILEAAKQGRLTVKTCTDRATNQQVDILCVETGNALHPVGKLYPDFSDANADVFPPREHGDYRILH
jgi:hypothetical protein